MAGITLKEALLTLHGTGPVLETAREVSGILQGAGIDGGVIGGVAVALHGHVRTTLDVDVFVQPPLDPLRKLLQDHGYALDREQREFGKSGVPVHLVTEAETGRAPQRYEVIDSVRLASLPDIINMKLRSGTRSIVRAQDLADVIGLIRARSLDGEFVRLIDSDLRPEFCKLLDAMRSEQ